MPETVTAPDLIVIGGVPGAGKSTAIAAVLDRDTALDQDTAMHGDPHVADVRALDSDQVRRGLAARLPDGLPYRWYRPVVHVVHLLRVLAWLALGPRRAGVRLIVHDPCTRLGRLHRLSRFARWRGWSPTLILVDVPRADARAGQLSRGRVIDPENFDRHWRRWLTIRAAHHTLPGWDSTVLVPRADAAYALSAALHADRMDVRQAA